MTPSPFTPLGAKGCGEGAMHTTPAAILSAINDALVPMGARATEVPATPNRLWTLIRGAKHPGCGRMTQARRRTTWRAMILSWPCPSAIS